MILNTKRSEDPNSVKYRNYLWYIKINIYSSDTPEDITMMQEIEDI